jgi:acetylornithine deacetylase
MKDIEWFRTYTFPRVSEYLGAVKMSVTMIEAGTQHNVVPDTCKYVVDVRVNEKYSNSELLELIKGEVKSEVKERSTRLNSSAIDSRHAIVQRGESLGLSCFGSPTMSDQALMPFTSIKIGPGDSARSHTANEYIRLTEIAQGVDTYVTLLHQLKL